MRDSSVTGGAEPKGGTPLMGFLSDQRLVRARRVSAVGDSLAEPPAAGGLDVWLTGTGTPAVLPGRSGPSTLLRSGQDLMLVDCGNGAAYQVARLGLDPTAITHVVITHHHADHNIDLGFLLMSGWITDREDFRPPVIVGPAGTTEFVNRLLAAFEYDVRARLGHSYDTERLTPQVLEVDDGTVFGGATWRATAFRVDHHPVCEAFGYRVDAAEASIAISGDTRPCDNLVRKAEGADMLIHEAIYPGYGYPEYHTLSTDVGRVAAKAGVDHLVLTHLLPGHLPDDAWMEHVRPDYDGLITVGHDLLKVW